MQPARFHKTYVLIGKEVILAGSCVCDKIADHPKVCDSCRESVATACTTEGFLCDICTAALRQKLGFFRRWTCEEHTGKEWPHDDCPGPGIPVP